MRILEAHQAGFGQRVDGDDLGAGPLCPLEGQQHPRMICARVLPKDEDQLGLLEIVKPDRPLAYADRRAQRRSARFMAHIRAVGQVVRAELPHEQLIEEGGFVARPPGRIEDRFIGRCEPVQFGGNQSERLVPSNRLVVRRAGRQEHGLRDSPLRTEPVVGLLGKLGDAMPSEEVGARAVGIGLPGEGLSAIFAELDHAAAFVRIGPGAAHAVDAARLVQAEQGTNSTGDAHFAPDARHGCGHGRDTPSVCLGRGNLRRIWFRRRLGLHFGTGGRRFLFGHKFVRLSGRTECNVRLESLTYFP